MKTNIWLLWIHIAPFTISLIIAHRLSHRACFFYRTSLSVVYRTISPVEWYSEWTNGGLVGNFTGEASSGTQRRDNLFQAFCSCYPLLWGRPQKCPELLQFKVKGNHPQLSIQNLSHLGNRHYCMVLLSITILSLWIRINYVVVTAIFVAKLRAHLCSYNASDIATASGSFRSVKCSTLQEASAKHKP